MGLDVQPRHTDGTTTARTHVALKQLRCMTACERHQYLCVGDIGCTDFSDHIPDVVTES